MASFILIMRLKIVTGREKKGILVSSFDKYPQIFVQLLALSKQKG